MSPTEISALMIGCLAAGVFFGYLICRSEYSDVDPWKIQHKIMRKSGQPTPDVIRVNKYTITYLALTFEELAETIAPVCDALARGCGLTILGDRPTTSSRTAGAVAVHQMLRNMGQDLSSLSRSLRAANERLPESFGVPMTRLEAKSFADGVTDTTVTVCGLAIASGVPGGPCYETVGLSNLSKADPITGLILKDASGKWIKGPNYVPPNIERVLDIHGAIGA
jgi:hypothetical protein